MRVNKNRIQAVFYNNPDQYPPIINGARLLVQRGYRVKIICRETGELWGVSYPAGVKLDRLDTRKGSSWQEYLGFVLYTITQRATGDIFFGHDMHGLLPARLLAWRYRRPLVYHCHDFTDAGQSLQLGSRVVRLFEHLFARTADLVIVPDADRAQVIARELRLRSQPLIVANGPLSSVPASGLRLREAIEAQGIYLERIVFRQGRIGEGHAIEATMRSIPRWASPRWGFVVMGTGDPAYLDHLRNLATTLGIEKQFGILPAVGYDEVAEFTPGADVGHALYEPTHINNVHITTASNKIMEYIAAGLPLLVSDRPALHTLVTSQRCGVVADEKSSESIANAINHLLEDPQQTRAMGVAARKTFEQNYAYEQQFAPAIAALHKLTDPVSKRRPK